MIYERFCELVKSHLNIIQKTDRQYFYLERKVSTVNGVELTVSTHKSSFCLNFRVSQRR